MKTISLETNDVCHFHCQPTLSLALLSYLRWMFIYLVCLHYNANSQFFHFLFCCFLFLVRFISMSLLGLLVKMLLKIWTFKPSFGLQDFYLELILSSIFVSL